MESSTHSFHRTRTLETDEEASLVRTCLISTFSSPPSAARDGLRLVTARFSSARSRTLRASLRKRTRTTRVISRASWTSIVAQSCCEFRAKQESAHLSLQGIQTHRHIVRPILPNPVLLYPFQSPLRRRVRVRACVCACLTPLLLPPAHQILPYSIPSYPRFATSLLPPRVEQPECGRPVS